MRAKLTVNLSLLLLSATAFWANAQDAGISGGSLGGAPGVSPASYQDSSGGVIGGRAGHPRIQPPRPGMRRVPGVEALPAPGGRPMAPGALGQFAFDAPLVPESEGPPDGLTLDQAIDQLVRGSLSLQAKHLDIPQARADELTASLRTNPFVFGDGQLVPYGRYSTQNNPGGPTQYDVNITYPVDWSRKRIARMDVAAQARRGVEAQFQDAVRLELDNLYTTYVDVLAARETMRFAEASMAAIDHALEMQEKRPDKSAEDELQADHIEIQRDAVELGKLDAEASLASAKRTLAMILNLPLATSQHIDLRSSLRDSAPEPPAVDELFTSALVARPDLAAFRLGVCRAIADVRLARANRFSDVYVLYQPFTYQDNGPFNLPSSRSWAVGATVTAPIFDRNQGNIRRAQVNVDQSRLEMQVVERRVLAEVEGARQEYEVSREMVDRIENRLLPAARHVRDHSLKLAHESGGDVNSYLIAQRDYQDLVRQYRDALVRHRRAMLKLNTAVGMRVLP
jgi:cobalt-zinc-cadmium efflux system outer membrane protein